MRHVNVCALVKCLCDACLQGPAVLPLRGVPIQSSSCICTQCALSIHYSALLRRLLAWVWDDLPLTCPAGGWPQDAEPRQPWCLLGASEEDNAPLETPKPPCCGQQVPIPAFNSAAVSCIFSVVLCGQLCFLPRSRVLRLSISAGCFCAPVPNPDWNSSMSQVTVHVIGLEACTHWLPHNHLAGHCAQPRWALHLDPAAA